MPYTNACEKASNDEELCGLKRISPLMEFNLNYI